MTAESSISLLDLLVLDIKAPKQEVEVLAVGSVLWVNVDGICRLRICQIPEGALRFDVAASRVIASVEPPKP